MSAADYELVLVGATGFTGALTAEYLVRHAPAGTRIALAGRDPSRLEAVASGLAEAYPDGVPVAMVHADMSDAESLRALAESTRVVASAVGPYVVHGEPLVSACAAAGTDYLDLAGEPAFVDRMWLRHHDRALETGARLVHSCGWTAVPNDLGTLFAIERLPAGERVRVRCLVELSSTLSGGAYRSMLANIARPRQTLWSAASRRRRERRPQRRRIRTISRPPLRAVGVRGVRLPYPTIDRETVLRSARALEGYGSDFAYGHYLVARRPNPVSAIKALASYRKPGQGPSAEERERGWFRETLIAENGDGRVVVEVSGGDPWYTEASKIFAEAALCLAHDELPEGAGQVTPAVAMGHALTGRLTRAGIAFREVEPADDARAGDRP